MNYKELEEYCNSLEEQRLIYLCVTERTLTEVAKRLSVSVSTVSRRVAKIKARVIEDAMSLTATTTEYGADGEVRRKWVRKKVEQEETLEALKEATDLIANQVEGKGGKTPKPIHIGYEDLVTAYVYTDLHLGQYSYHEETGANFDTNIGLANTTKSMKLLVDTTPLATTALLIDLGDTLHSKDDNARTNSGHALDTDSRHSRVYKMLLEMKIEMVKLALAKHPSVKYITVAGNHSDLVSIYLRSFLSAYFRYEPRFSVEESPALHQYYQHGKTLLGFHHGHSTKMTKLPEVMAWDCQDIFSETKFRYYLTGHVHSSNVLDSRICKVESFRNLTPNDAWAQGAGYRSHKEVVAITYHREFGEIARNTVSLDMVTQS